MFIYYIPINKIEKLEKLIKKYSKKNNGFSITIGNEVIKSGSYTYFNEQVRHEVTIDIKVRCKEVSVTGEYKINGWQFVGIIDFTGNGNIIRLADSSFEGRVPEKYKHTEKICEHCGKIRNRKDTYLIYNEETNEFKQVGSSCLLDYTLGMDAQVCAEMMSCLHFFDIESKLNYANDDFMLELMNENSAVSYGNVLAIKEKAIGLVKAHGYARMFNGKGTAAELARFCMNSFAEEFKDVMPATEDEVNEIDAYAKQYIESDSNFLRNASLAWLKKYIECRDFSLIGAFINAFIKEKNEKEIAAKRISSMTNKHVGNIGERIAIKVASVRVLFEKDNSWKSYYAGISYMLEIIDTEGHTYIWSASTDNVHVGDTIVATIKDHSTYKGINQTIITRGKISC